VHFTATAEQQMLIDSASRLTRSEFGPVNAARDLPVGIPRNYLSTFADHGLAAITVPESAGGQGGNLLDAVLAIEAVAQVNPIAGDAIQALNFGAVQQIAHLGTEAVKEKFLRPCLAGEMLTAIAMSEPEAGSSVSELRTTARRNGGQVILNGSKIFTTNGADADFFVVWVRFAPGPDGIGAVIVERGSVGFTVDSSNAFLSGEHYGLLYLSDCTVAEENILVSENGFRTMISVFNVERLGNAARSLALGQAAFDQAIAHARDRVQFGRRLTEFQGLQWRLAEMMLKLESARLLLYRAATNADAGLPSEVETAMAKLACNRAGFEVANEALQIFGGYGYDADSLVGYLFRRTRGWMIAGGTCEQMLNRIARGIVQQASTATDSYRPPVKRAI
jgi:alkylation response protein AidB-like acyl-CoA dehydrogenase